MSVVDAIENMPYGFELAEGRILLCSPIDAHEYAMVGNHFSLENGLPSAEVLFELPRRLGASSVLFGSQATRSVFDPDEADFELFHHLMAASEEAGIPIYEHVLVQGNLFRFMLETLAGVLDPEND